MKLGQTKKWNHEINTALCCIGNIIYNIGKYKRCIINHGLRSTLTMIGYICELLIMYFVFIQLIVFLFLLQSRRSFHITDRFCSRFHNKSRCCCQCDWNLPSINSCSNTSDERAINKEGSVLFLHFSSGQITYLLANSNGAIERRIFKSRCAAYSFLWPL